MRLKINSGIKLTQEQVFEIAEIMNEPDMGWGYNQDTRKNDLKIYIVELVGEYATYTYRVNNINNMITILSVE